MLKRRYSRTEARYTYSVAKEQIHSKDYFFVMRSKEQEEYHPKNIQAFTDECYKYAYRIQDMAALVSSSEISNFLTDFAFKLRSNKIKYITREELDLVKKFINDADDGYKNSKYIPLHESVV